MSPTLQHKRALVTGGSRGIGAAIVKRLVSEGAHVALTYVSKPDQANETVQAADECQWHSRYGQSAEHQHPDGDDSIKKKEPQLEQVNHAMLCVLSAEQVEVEILRADELDERRGLSSEPDEMWSFAARKSNPRWLWHAIDYHTGMVLAYIFGRRQDEVFLKLKELLEPFGITRYYTDGWGAYERHLEPDQHTVGKDNTQKIESKHINLQTRIKRLVRRTICFSKSEQMHDVVMGPFINRYEFGWLL